MIVITLALHPDEQQSLPLEYQLHGIKALDPCRRLWESSPIRARRPNAYAWI